MRCNYEGVKKDHDTEPHSRINPAEENGFYHTADNRDIAQRKRDDDTRRDHDGTVRGRGQRLEERDVCVRRRGRRHPDIWERETVTQGKSALGNKRTPRGLHEGK